MKTPFPHLNLNLLMRDLRRKGVPRPAETYRGARRNRFFNRTA